MNTFSIILTWGGVGVAIGIGIVAVIAVAVKLCEIYDKLFPKKKGPEVSLLESQLNTMGRDYVVFSYELKMLTNLLLEKLKDLRFDLWSLDYVLPSISIATANFPVGKNCAIRIEGKEIFNGEIVPQYSDEKKADFIAWKIRKYFEEKAKDEEGEKLIEAD